MPTSVVGLAKVSAPADTNQQLFFWLHTHTDVARGEEWTGRAVGLPGHPLLVCSLHSRGQAWQAAEEAARIASKPTLSRKRSILGNAEQPNVGDTWDGCCQRAPQLHAVPPKRSTQLRARLEGTYLPYPGNARRQPGWAALPVHYGFLHILSCVLGQEPQTCLFRGTEGLTPDYFCSHTLFRGNPSTHCTPSPVPKKPRIDFGLQRTASALYTTCREALRAWTSTMKPSHRKHAGDSEGLGGSRGAPEIWSWFSERFRGTCDE